VIGVPVTAKGDCSSPGHQHPAPRSLTRKSPPVRGHRRQIGLAVENARLYELERQARRGGTPPNRGRRPAGDPGRSQFQPALQETLDRIITQTCRVTGSDAASLLQRESPDSPSRSSRPAGWTTTTSQPSGFRWARGGWQSPGGGGPVVVSDAAAIVDRWTQEPDRGTWRRRRGWSS